jgi:hypothetical protein
VERWTVVWGRLGSTVGVSGWARASQEQAVRNARAASVECSRRRVERAEVEAYLEERLASRAPAYDVAREVAASTAGGVRRQQGRAVP